MNKKTVTISMNEYEKLLQSDNLCHKQRFTIRALEKEIERIKAQSSLFAKNTLLILMGSGYTMEQIMIMYESMKGKKYD